MKFPNFIIIGATKCGTTALMVNLNKHPNIKTVSKTETSVEMHFWGYPIMNRYGFDWYKKKFDDDKVCGEKSTDYWIKRKSMRLIKENIPNVKLILCVRNPADRAFSNYQMHYRRGKVENFSYGLFLNDANYFKKGLYYNNLKNNVLPFFDADDIYICITEKMKADTSNEMAKLYRFLGVENFELDVVDDSKNMTKEKIGNFASYLRKNENRKCYVKWSMGTDSLTGKLRREIVEYYKPYNKKFYEFLGYKIKEWDK